MIHIQDRRPSQLFVASACARAGATGANPARSARAGQRRRTSVRSCAASVHRTAACHPHPGRRPPIENSRTAHNRRDLAAQTWKALEWVSVAGNKAAGSSLDVGQGSPAVVLQLKNPVRMVKGCMQTRQGHRLKKCGWGRAPDPLCLRCSAGMREGKLQRVGSYRVPTSCWTSTYRLPANGDDMFDGDEDSIKVPPAARTKSAQTAQRFSVRIFVLVIGGMIRPRRWRYKCCWFQVLSWPSRRPMSSTFPALLGTPATRVRAALVN
jgi:hypothetical protein